MVARGDESTWGPGEEPPLYDAIDYERTRGSVAARLFGRKSKPTKLGRFIIEGNAGAGQMGRVYLAYDPELDRRVAIKVLHVDGSSERARRREERLRLEAQALAQLSDPHVVAVHEVGRHRDALFLVMELVQGVTLRHWLEVPRAWPQVVSVLVDAARGLAAAHRAGVLHRDFKPANAMIREDGRVAVLDFGLSRRGAEVESSEENQMLPDSSITAEGNIVGSPAYMAPEVLRGDEADARSDQFSFCVTLYEALYGQRPFGGALDRGLRPPDLDALPRPRRVPDWLHALVLRGMHDRRAARHESMDAIVAELTRRRLTPRRVATGAVAVTALVGAGAGLATVLERPAEPPCGEESARLEATWNTDVRRRMRDALAAGAGKAVADRADARLDDYATAWSDAQRRACRETHVDRAWSERMLDLRSACLAARLDQFEALIGVLSESDASIQRLAPAAVNRLPSLEPCEDPDHLEATVPEPTDRARASRVAELRHELAGAQALLAAGRYRDAAAAAEEIVTRAKPVAFPPLDAEALLAKGLAAHRMESPQAERHVRDAVNVAEAAGHDRVSLRGWRLLVWAAASGERASLALERMEALTTRLGASPRDRETLAAARGHVATRLGNHTAAVEHFMLALTAARDRGDEGAVSAAEYLLSMTRATSATGEYDAALRWAAEAEAALTAAYGTPHPLVGRALSNRAVLSMRAGQVKRAVPIAESAVAMQRSVHGPAHPDVATALVGLGGVQYTLGRREDALTSFEEAIRIETLAYGADAPEVAGALGNTARVLAELGRPDEAIRRAERAVAILEGADQSGAAVFTITLATLADCYGAAGRRDDAVEVLRRVLAIEVERFGSRHREPALTRVRLADALREAGHVDEAYDLAREGLAQLREEHEGRSHRELVDALLILGRITDARGEAEAARGHWEEAVAIAEQSDGTDDLLAQLREALARQD